MWRPPGNRVSKTRVPVDHLLPSFFFFFFPICYPKTVLPSSSSPSSNIQTLFSKSQPQKPWSRNRSKNPNPKFTILGPKHHGFDDLSTEAAWVCWSQHQRFVFCVFWVGLSPMVVNCFLGWFVFDEMFSRLVHLGFGFKGTWVLQTCVSHVTWFFKTWVATLNSYLTNSRY